MKDLFYLTQYPSVKHFLGATHPIVHITKNSLHQKVGKNRYIAHFYTRNWVEVWLKRLQENLTLAAEDDLVKLLNKKEDAIEQYLGYGERGFAHIYLASQITVNTAGDGRIFNQNATYATARNATTGTTGTQTTRPVNSRIGGSGDYFVARGFAPFDISSIPLTATVLENASSFIRCKGDGVAITNNNTDSLSVVESTQASPTALATGDYDNIGTTKLANDLLFSSYTSTSGENNDLTLNTAGVAFVQGQLGGDAMFCWRTSREIAGNTPTNDNYVGMQEDNNLLSIEYTLPSGGNPIFFSSGGLGLS